MQIRDATTADFLSILAMNEASVQYLSPLSEQRLQYLHQISSYHRVLVHEREVIAFLLVLGPGKAYDSVNYRWFSERQASYPDFLYIDRVVVSLKHQGQQLGQRLYQDLFEFAKQTQASCITCEFDIDPPNEASARIHQRFGFKEVGTQAVANGKKQVSLQAVRV